MSSITVNAHPVYVSDEGDGPCVVMLHGLGGSTSMFQPQARALSGRARVIRIDLSGSGLSPNHSGDLSIDGWAEDVVAVLDALGVTDVLVVAHSLGTLVANRCAVRYPDRIRALVELGPVRAQPDPVKTATRERAATVRAGGMEVVVDGVLAMAVPEPVRRGQPVVEAFVHASLLGQDPRGYAASCEALAAADEPDWAAITAPVWLIGGEEDRLSTPATIDAIEAELATTQRIRVQGAGHWLSIEQPVLISNVIAEAIDDALNSN